MNFNIHKYRSSLARGASALALTLLLFCGTGCRNSKSTDSKANQPITEVIKECTSTTMATTSTTTTTATTTTTTTVMTTSRIEKTEVTTSQTIVVVTEPIYIEPEVVEPVTEYIEPVTEYSSYADSDTILLAQLINKEASATYEGKLAVASVVVNRSNYFGQSISDVIYAPNQFTTCWSLGYYTNTDYQAAQEILTNGSINNAFYFDGCHPDCKNWFRDINNNYIGAW